MHILLIEDDTYKANKIVRFLKDALPAVSVEISRSVNSGLEALVDHRPDTVLLDMSLTTFDVGPREPGGRPQNFGGFSILENILREKLSVSVIVITQFESFRRGDKTISLDKLREELKERYGGVFDGLIYYNSADIAWENQLRKLLTRGGGEDGYHFSG